MNEMRMARPLPSEARVQKGSIHRDWFHPMLLTVDTRDAGAVSRQVIADYRLMFPGEDSGFIQEAFRMASDCFAGRHPDYLPIDARYHDFEHTLQGTLCLSALLRGRFETGVEPALTARMFRLGLYAILLHDTGYLKHRDDRLGTGAKYTLTHVSRSCDFAARLLGAAGYGGDEIRSVQNMIRCTGVDVDLTAIQFSSELERVVGYALGTADLVGQMAASDYVDKLPVLYEEFLEAARFSKLSDTAMMSFASADDLMRKTPGFWERYVRPKLEREFLGLFRFLARPAPNGPNNYIGCVEANIARLRAQATAKASVMSV